MMTMPSVDCVVRLTADIPELELSRGQKGIVRSKWFDPTTAYEVEFSMAGKQYPLRALLLSEQVYVEVRDEMLCS